MWMNAPVHHVGMGAPASMLWTASPVPVTPDGPGADVNWVSLSQCVKGGHVRAQTIHCTKALKSGPLPGGCDLITRNATFYQ